MKISDFVSEKGSGSSSKLWFNLHNIALTFGFVFFCFHRDSLLIEGLGTYGAIVHGSRLTNKFVAAKYGASDVGSPT